MNHWDAYQGSYTARDIGGPNTGWTGTDSVTFTVDPYNTQGKVVQATVNCPNGGPDKYVMLELWLNGTMYGRVDYVHLRTLNVSVGQWIGSGTVLGAIQNQPSSKSNGESCWTGVHTHLGTDVGSWHSGNQWETQPYSNWVLSYAFPGMRPIP